MIRDYYRFSFKTYETDFICSLILFLVTLSFMYYRCLYGSTLIDEAYYVAEAKAVLDGNFPFSYACNPSVGFSIFLIPIVYVYRIINTELEGLFLFTRFLFITYKLMICLYIYMLLKKELESKYLFLLLSIILTIYVYLPNFSYNTIPILHLFLAGCLLYNVVAQNKGCISIVIAGLCTGVSICANPGYGLSVVVFLGLLWNDIKKENRLKTICLFVGTIIISWILVSVPIIYQTSFQSFFDGVFRSFISPIPMDSLNPNKTWIKVVKSFYGPIRDNFLILISVSVLSFFDVRRYFSDEGRKLEFKDSIYIAITISMFVRFVYIVYKAVHHDFTSAYMSPPCAFAAVIYLFVFAILGLYKNEKIIWYLTLCPILYSISAIILLDVNPNVWRFTNSYIIIVPLLYVLMKHKNKIMRIISIMIGIMLIYAMGFANYSYVLDDNDMHSLNIKVDSGVFKGVYTKRAHDLEELEGYLNSLIGENETYAFRDNIPGAYLMMHHGIMCEISTWDCLQYHYHANSPAKLYDYYKRRKMIPNKIIYVDYGRDKQLSIDNPNFRYNDFVNTYYDLVEDIELNETFKRVKVYQYNGKFDGNYQYWIDTYWQPTKPKKSLF